MRVHVRKQYPSNEHRRVRFRYGRVPQALGDYTLQEIKDYEGQINMSFSRTFEKEHIDMVLDKWKNKNIKIITAKEKYYGE